MENNKLLIGVQFTYLDVDRFKHTNIELYVLRDLTLRQLISGVKYGIAKLAEREGAQQEVFRKCSSIFRNCVSKTARRPDGRTCLTHITYTSYNQTAVGAAAGEEERFPFYLEDLSKPICELGFITSTRLIFDETGSFRPQGVYDTRNVIEPFNPAFANRIVFPEYNISTRQLWQFDETPVDNQFIQEYLPQASGDYIKIYLYGLMFCYHPEEEVSLERMSHDLNLPTEEIEKAFRYWERQGTVRRVSDRPPTWKYVNLKRKNLVTEEPVDPDFSAFGEALYDAFDHGRRLQDHTCGYRFLPHPQVWHFLSDESPLRPLDGCICSLHTVWCKTS